VLLDWTDRLQRWWLVSRGFRSRHVDTSVGRVHVLDAKGSGDGPPVLVLHGISAAAVHFDRVLLRLLRTSRRVIAPDMPAHGFSDVPAAGLTVRTLEDGLREALDAVVDEPVVFFGNSLGGAGAVRFAASRPDRVRALCLCSPGGARVDAQELSRFLRSFALEDVESAAAFVDRIHAAPPWYRRVIAPFVRARFHAPHMRAFVGSLTPDDLLRPDELAALTMPVLVLWGRRDALMPKEHLSFFRRHLPEHARIEEPDFGHCPNLDQPRALADAIAAYAREVA
jgi:pimeloyl-ACP methyl ester carboxylesterase